MLVYLTCYQVLRAAGDPRAESVLTAGYSLLSKRAAQFVDDERRAQFLDNLPAHRTLDPCYNGTVEAPESHGA